MARSETKRRDPFRDTQEWVKRNQTWIAFAIFVIATLLVYVIKVVDKPWLVITTGMAVLLSVLDRLVKVGSGVDDMLNLQRTAVQPVYNLAQCMDDLHDRLELTPRAAKVVIKHLGLDMTGAWNDLKRAIASCDAASIECQILIMTDNPDELGPDAPEEMYKWCRSVPGSVRRIVDETISLGDFLSDKGTTLELTLCMYKGTPRIHGVVVAEPFERGYISFASWAENAAFEWGGDDYFAFSNGTISKADRRLRELLRGAFEYLWRGRSVLIFAYPASGEVVVM